ncbi:C45 family peptidase [Pseudonocardia sp. TRM90224]|uniref:C45 family peptidase n=1 Tax=Pseudonocardia sp. TRM90224 TaxID=2812678 RepID=UPI001E4341F7|nr:C45 family peptidase [Pseudonocardia sp. TRM90224]
MTTDIVAGGDTDFMTVRRITASGSQREIGRELADAARATYGWAPQPAERRKARARRLWFERNWPQHHARMQGTADALGVDLEADELYLDGLAGVPEGSACSVTFYPPAFTKEGSGLLGRNYDFFTVSQAGMVALMSGEPMPTDQPAWASRPHVLHSRPDDGPATIVLTMDQLDGAMEGINEHGLAVALLMADAQNTSMPEDGSPQVGLSGLQLPRFLLDTCATAEEARAALYDTKQHDHGVQLHYLVADASGDAFVWERASGGQEYVTSSDRGALCVTNHPLFRHGTSDLPQDDAESMLTYGRYRALAAQAEETVSGESLRAVLDGVRFDAATAEGYPVRTLWRSVFDVGARSMSTEFYLADGIYSPELTFEP